MKIHHFVILFLGAIIFSCKGQKESIAEVETDAGTTIYSFKDSCEHLVLSLSLEVPSGKDSASLQIRDSLISDFIRNAEHPGYEEEGMPGLKPYTGDKNDVQAIVDYYGKADYESLLKQAMSDYEQRIQYLDEDTTMSEEDKKMIKEDIPLWAFDLNIKKTTDNNDFVVYYSQTYVYYGGAHGGIVGTGSLTFDKTTGCKIDHFIKPDATTALQPLIRKGLLRYYAEAGDTITDSQLSERLQIEGKIIPQPQNAEYPNASGDSLTFTYGQYEIACYADGMPSFKIAVKELAPYLTSEGKKMFQKCL